MKRHHRATLATALAGSGLVFFSAFALGAQAPRSTEDLVKSAACIVTGEVIEVTSRMGKAAVEKAPGVHRDRHFEIKLKVESVSQGEGIKAGDEIGLKTWQIGPRRPPLPGHQGQNWVPQTGERATFYLKAKDGDAYEVLLPNGIARPSAPEAGKAPVAAAKRHLRAFLRGDAETLKTSYAANVQLLPGHEMLKDEYGLAEAGARATGATVARDKLAASIAEVMAKIGGFSEETLDQILETMKYEPLPVTKGEVVTDASDPVQTADGKLHFTTEPGDILLKIAPPEGDFFLLQLRKIDGEWAVMAEYID